MSYRVGPDLIEYYEDEPSGPFCPDCGQDLDWIDCDQCGGEGLSYHDCGEDCCCCLYPEPNVQCDQCEGKGGWWWCTNRACREKKDNDDDDK